jgi:phosphoribosyl-ATP pyrophosphohydrolase/phosphoribosyl-AMP cyclohydrolase
MSTLEFLQQLESVIRKRINDGGEGSYTFKLAQSGIRRVAQKVGEEGVELALAGVSGDDEEVVQEAADLIYHLIVLLELRGLSMADVSKALQVRHET